MRRNGPAARARQAAFRARVSIASRDWDAQNRFWLTGHLLGGTPVRSAGSGGIGILDEHVFDAEQADRILDRLSAPDFMTGWGIRSLSADDPAYDPNAYASGSVSALGTSEAATYSGITTAPRRRGGCGTG